MRLRGETVGEITACARAMRRAALTLDHPHQVIDVCGTGGDGVSHLQHLHRGGLRGGRRRPEGRQARQPHHDSPIRQRRRAGRAGRQHPGQPRAAAPGAGRGRRLLPVRPGAPRRHAPRAADPPGAGLPHGVQPAGTALQPGRRAAAGAGGVRRALGRAAGAGAGRARASSAPGWCTATAWTR